LRPNFNLTKVALLIDILRLEIMIMGFGDKKGQHKNNMGLAFGMITFSIITAVEALHSSGLKNNIIHVLSYCHEPSRFLQHYYYHSIQRLNRAKEMTRRALEVWSKTCLL
jgi:hypothetical protein